MEDVIEIGHLQAIDFTLSEQTRHDYMMFIKESSWIKSYGK